VLVIVSAALGGLVGAGLAWSEHLAPRRMVGMNEPTGQRAGAFVVTGLAGLLAGAALMSLIAHEPVTAGDPEGTPQADQNLVRELHEVATGLAALSEALGRGQTATPTEPRQPETLRAEAGEGAALQSLADAIARLSERLATPVGAGGSSPTLTIPPPAPAQQERVTKVFDMDITSLRARHMLWTEQQALDTYGPPTSIEPRERGVSWIWYTTAGPSLSLTFLDGRVISTNRNDR